MKYNALRVKRFQQRMKKIGKYFGKYFELIAYVVLLLYIIIDMDWDSTQDTKDNMLILYLITIFYVLAVIIWKVINEVLEGTRLSSKKVKEKIDDTTVILLYVLSFFIPLAGFIVGALYASKDEEHYKHVGKNCLKVSALNIVLGIVMVTLLFA